MKKVAVVGEIVVEIMADETGEGFLQPLALTGPFPSGAPAIFIDQVAKLGQPCGIVSCVGRDDFGRVNVARLQKDGVDISAISIAADYPTGTAFVRYRDTGARDFVFNIAQSACGQIDRTPEAEKLLAEADHLHVMGSSLFSDRLIRFNLDLVSEVKNRGGTVSFDPNIRKEMLVRDGMRDAMDQVLQLTDVFLPSGDELTLLTHNTTQGGAISELLSRGVTAIVHKRGADGAAYHDRHQTISASGIPVTEVDPTGAGDSFGGAFVTFWLRGTDPKIALMNAMAAGARAVTMRGPMEGTSTMDELQTMQKNAVALT